MITAERRQLWLNTGWQRHKNMFELRFNNKRGKLEHRRRVWAALHLLGQPSHLIYASLYRDMRGRRFTTKRVRVQ